MKDEHGKDAPQLPEQSASLEPKMAELPGQTLEWVVGGAGSISIKLTEENLGKVTAMIGKHVQLIGKLGRSSTLKGVAK